MRQRIRGEQIVEHDVVHPQVAVIRDDDLFGVCPLTYDPCFATFATHAAKCIAEAEQSPSLKDFPHDQEGKIVKDDILSISIIPWLSFTSFSLTRRPQVDSIPLLAWGKVMKEGDRYLLPFFVNFHHALVDGVHIGRFFERLEREAREFAAGLG